jgi:hypothetical protein
LFAILLGPFVEQNGSKPWLKESEVADARKARIILS